MTEWLSIFLVVLFVVVMAALSYFIYSRMARYDKSTPSSREIEKVRTSIDLIFVLKTLGTSIVIIMLIKFLFSIYRRSLGL